jgi:hypothetical protein
VSGRAVGGSHWTRDVVFSTEGRRCMSRSDPPATSPKIGPQARTRLLAARSRSRLGMGQRECAEHFWAGRGQKPIPRLKAPRPQRQSDDPGRVPSTAAPLGLAFDGGAQFPAKCKSAAFMARMVHGTGHRIRAPRPFGFRSRTANRPASRILSSFTAGPQNVWRRPRRCFCARRLAAV